MSSVVATERPTMAVWKFASCDGCQLSLLDCEDELLGPGQSSAHRSLHRDVARQLEGPYDISLVEGSITTSEDVERIKAVRASSRYLVTIGACAATGGVQALRNFVAPGEFAGAVYAHPEYLDSLDRSTPISSHVVVDYELHGCPIDRGQLLEVLLAFLAGRRPVIASHSVCQECKARGTVCLMVAGRPPCLGPVTRAGCGALCPVDRPRVLWLLRAERQRQLRRALDATRRARHVRRRGGSTLWHLQRCGARFHGAVSGAARPVANPHDGVRRTRRHAMTHGAKRTRTISAEGISRVEGEGSLRVLVEDGLVTEVALDIFEPPRYFEALLVGRHFSEAPDITARICGICPVAYQMSACLAMEDACGVVVDEGIAALRRLLYCGEWIQSHALHIYLLHAPDFLDCADAVQLAERDPDTSREAST
jgi:sulfhydrogenase subunit delta